MTSRRRPPPPRSALDRAARTTVTHVRAAKARVETLVGRVAWVVGWVGVAALVACAGLAWLPPPEWPAPLNPQKLPTYAVLSLLCASLVGWSFIQRGQDRLRALFGPHSSAFLFAIVPAICGLVATLAGLFGVDVLVLSGLDRENQPLALLIRWYPPILVALCLTAFVVQAAEARRRGRRRERLTQRLGRSAGSLLLVAPYALIFAYLAFGVPVHWLDEPLDQALRAMGSTAIVLQLVLAHFIRGPAAPGRMG